MGLTTGKIVEMLFGEAVDTYEEQNQILDLVTFKNFDPATMQNAGNVIWRQVQQRATVKEGWDMTGQATGIIQETYPALLELPKNDVVQQRADDLRDMSFWEDRGKEAGRQQAMELNKTIAQRIATQGSIFYRSNATSGLDFIGEAQVLMNERQLKNMGRNFILNDRTTQKFSQDLAARQTLQGKPDETWRTGQIGKNIAEFDVHTGSYLPNLAGGADPATTVTGNQSFKPEAGSVNTSTGVVTNVDYRIATMPVAASASYNVGDKVQIKNGGVAVMALGLGDKQSSGQPMTFTIVAKPDGTHISVYPKPIAADDAALTDLEKMYANIDTVILNAATVNRVNIDTSAKVNLFWDKSAVEVMGGKIPAKLFQEFAGKKYLSQTLKSGLEMYIFYDGDIMTMNFNARLFVWYGITIAAPFNCGVSVSY